MWYPVKIEFENLFAHLKSSYEFQNNKCTVIFGNNKTDKGFENNGAGKSTLLEAIAIAYTGSSLRNLNKEAFINSNEDFCIVDFHLRNDVLNKKLRIYRKIFRSNKSAIIKIYEDDVWNEKIVSVNEANKRIVELIGISNEDLLRYYIISQDSKYSFFTAGDVEKKEIMNRITSADMINPIFVELKKREKENKEEKEELQTKRDKLSGKIQTVEEQIEELKESSDITKQINELKESKRKSKEALEEAKTNLTSYEKKLKIKNDKLTLEEAKTSEVEGLKERRTELNTFVQSNNKDIKGIDIKLSGVITCPNCNEDFLLEEEEEKHLSIDELKDKKTKLAKKLVKYDVELGEIKTKLDDIEEVLDTISTLKAEIRNIKRQKDIADYDISAETKKIEKISKQIKELKNSSENEKLTTLEQKLETLKTEDEELGKSISEVQAKLDMVSYWQYYMGKNGFTTFLANKSIRIIEGITNSFLRRFKVEITVLINGFKINKDKSVREKIDVYINNNSLEAKLFMSNSGGERGRVIIAGILGIQHLINLSTEGNGLNLLCLDEAMHGIDSTGNENMIKILEKLGITILLITQNVNESFNVENCLRVEKVNGISKYI